VLPCFRGTAKNAAVVRAATLISQYCQDASPRGGAKRHLDHGSAHQSREKRAASTRHAGTAEDDGGNVGERVVTADGADGSPVALIRRFDRRGNGQRVMYISAATMLGVEATEPDDHTYTQIVDAIRVNGADAQADIQELWRRIVFAILITNVDDHLRNHGFLHEDRALWRLSPPFRH
jgi:hypothetical protein